MDLKGIEIHEMDKKAPWVRHVMVGSFNERFWKMPKMKYATMK